MAESIIKQDENGKKLRLFVDMDGTLAVFKPVDTLETLYEEGYFLNLEPQMNVVKAVNRIVEKHPEIEVNILSSVLRDSKYALEEKNAWLDRYLPGIDAEHRIFPPCGKNKAEYIGGELSENDYLLDDYTANLNAWEPPARGIKLLNGINGTKGTWQSLSISKERVGVDLAERIVNTMTLNDKFQCRDLSFINSSTVDECRFIFESEAMKCCAADVRAAITEHYDGYSVKGNPEDVLADYGNERVMLVLAATIQSFRYDGRISQANKDWAKNFLYNNDLLSSHAQFLASFTIYDVNLGMISIFTDKTLQCIKEKRESATENLAETNNEQENNAVEDVVFHKRGR